MNKKCHYHPRYGRGNMEETHNNHPKIGDCKTCESIATAQQILLENPLDQKYFEISEAQATGRLPHETAWLWRRKWEHTLWKRRSEGRGRLK